MDELSHEVIGKLRERFFGNRKDDTNLRLAPMAFSFRLAMEDDADMYVKAIRTGFGQSVERLGLVVFDHDDPNGEIMQVSSWLDMLTVLRCCGRLANALPEAGRERTE